MILHLVSKADWDAQPANQPYRAASLESEGFIHCTSGEGAMLRVANAFYKDQPGELYVLHIDETKLTSEVKWEAPADPKAEGGEQGSGGAEAGTQVDTKDQGDKRDKVQTLPPEVVAEHGDSPPHPSARAPLLFPHVYGPINREAIVGMRRFTRAEDGTFTGYAQIDESELDPNNPLNVKTPSQMADELLGATDEFSESLKRFKDRVEGRMTEIDEKIKKL